MNYRLNVYARLVLSSVPALLIAGCASDGSMQRYVPQIVTPYRIDIQQGNFVTQDMVDKLAVGQTRDQVRFILGTPLLTDVFHANRWDYVFRSSRGWNEPERRRLVIYFDADSRVTRWETDIPPPPATSGAPDKPAPSAPVAGPSVSDVRPPAGSSPSGASAASAAPAAVVPAAPSLIQETPQPAAAVVPAGPTSDAPPVPLPAPAPALASAPAEPAAPTLNPLPPAPNADIDRKQASAPDAGNAAPREVLRAVEEWRAAWSAREVERYLATYAANFKPGGGLSRPKWEQQRRERLRRASFVVVKVVDPQVTVAGSEATAVFTQIYESDTLKESGRKRLGLVLAGDRRWRIREESFEK